MYIIVYLKKNRRAAKKDTTIFDSDSENDYDGTSFNICIQITVSLQSMSFSGFFFWFDIIFNFVNFLNYIKLEKIHENWKLLLLLLATVVITIFDNCSNKIFSRVV